MAIINYVRRKDLLNAGLSNSELIHLFQRCEYFRNRKEETSIYLQFDVLMIFIALELSNFLSLRNVSETISDLTKHCQNLCKLLKKNKKQFLVVEKKTDTEMVIEESFYIAFPVFMDSLKVFNWDKRESMVLLNLEKLFDRVEDLFEKEAVQVAE